MKHLGDRCIAIGDHQQHVAGARHGPQGGGGVVVHERDRGERTRPDDHRVDELHRHVLGVLAGTGGPAPEGAAGREPSGERESGARERRCGIPQGIAVTTLRHVAPLRPR